MAAKTTGSSLVDHPPIPQPVASRKCQGVIESQFRYTIQDGIGHLRGKRLVANVLVWVSRIGANGGGGTVLRSYLNLNVQRITSCTRIPARSPSKQDALETCAHSGHETTYQALDAL